MASNPFLLVDAQGQVRRTIEDVILRGIDHVNTRVSVDTHNAAMRLISMKIGAAATPGSRNRSFVASEGLRHPHF